MRKVKYGQYDEIVQRLMFKIENQKTKGNQRFTDFSISCIKCKLKESCKRLKPAVPHWEIAYQGHLAA